MARLPHSVFKRILSFKDPRYERVRNGDPYMATPTRVWHTYEERRKAGHTYPYEDVPIYDRPSDYHWGTPAIERAGPESQPVVEPWMEPRIVLAKEDKLLLNVQIRVIGRWRVAHDDHQRYKFDPWKLQKYDWGNEDFAKLSLQCEACGPDLELYDMMRRRRRQ